MASSIFDALTSAPTSGVAGQRVDPTFNQLPDTAVDTIINTALGAANKSIQGTWPMPGSNNFSEFPKLSPSLFAELHPEERQTYLNGIMRLPDPNLSMFFGLPYDTRWSNEMIQQYMQPYMDIHLSGMPMAGQLSGQLGGQ